MAFKHKKVSELSLDQPAYPHGPLMDFRHEVEHTLRGVKTAPRDAETAWVYVEGEFMVRGYIGYGDFQSSRYGDKKFAVFARGIENGKYADHSTQYHMKTSVNMSTMLKAARGYLTKYRTQEIEGTTRRNARDKVNEKFVTLRNRVSDLYRRVGVQTYGQHKERMLREFKHLIESGHKFFDAEFDADVRDMLTTLKTLDSIGDTTPMDFVHIYPTPWETRADIIQITDVDRFTISDSQSGMLTWVADELPESIRGKIAVMSMCEDGHYVDGVGYKVDDRTFYFHKEGDDTWT